jgi:hypothetical protein
VNLDKELKQLKAKAGDLNAEGVKITEEIKMLKEAFDKNQIARIEINAQIKFVEGILADGGK